jgi:hypothetical protein
MLRRLPRALLPLPHVQFWQAENSCRLDRSHRRRHRRNIPCLVDASNVRTMNALKPGSEVNGSEVNECYGIYRQPCQNFHDEHCRRQ